MARHAKQITKKEDLDYLLNMTEEQAARKSTIYECFADFGDGPRFNPYDTIEIPAGYYGKTKKNTNKFTTTVGLWVFNKGMIEDLSDVLGYINTTIDGDVYEDINRKVSYAKLEDKITVQQLKDYIMQPQIYMGCTSAIAPSHTMKLLTVTDEMEKKKKQLEKKYAKALEDVDIKEIGKMENELLDDAKEYLKDDESIDMFNSKARSSWGNNFKNMYVMKGVITRTDGTYNVVKSSYISGLDKEDFAKTNDSAIEGPYARAVDTAKGGYLEKQFVSGFQHVKILPPGSDCKTKRTITITLNKKNIKMFMYSFIIEGSKLIEITSDNMNKYIGKTVKIRYSSMCEAKNGICEKCAGTLFNRLGISNVGVATAQIASRIKVISMKSFHDSTLDLSEMDVEKTFGLK